MTSEVDVQRSKGARVTLRHVAQQAGVSITTVSRALAGYPDVSEATRARIRALAQQLGYRPSLRAQTLALGQRATMRCAVVSLDLAASWLPHSVHGPVIPGILAGATAEGMDLTLVTLDAKGPSRGLADFAAEDRADGIVLLAAAPVNAETVAPLDQSGIPYVLVNRHFDHEPEPRPVNCVTPDWAEATRDAVHRLHRLGHRRIVALFRRETSMTSAALDHELGWRQGLADCEIDPDDAPILHATGRISEQAGYDFGRQLLNPSSAPPGGRPTAIVTYTEPCAQGVLRAARELNVPVPDQLTVIGFDNLIGQYLWPPLCSYDSHFYTVGVEASSLLASLLRGEEGGDSPRRVTLPLDYVCRATCAPAP